MPAWIVVLLLLVAALAAITVTTAWARRRGAEAWPVRTRAWNLTEGTELPGDVVVLQVDREPLLGTVRVLTDQPTGASCEYRADDLVEIVRLAG